MDKQLDSSIDIIETISRIKDMKDSKNLFWKSFYGKNKKTHFNSGLKILILNSPCYGFGDVVFCLKISTFLRKWYNAQVTIASTDVESFKKLDKNIDIVKLVSRNKGSQCRRFKYLSVSRNIPKHDLIFVAPVPSDYNVNLQDVKYLIPYANKFNTFFFSEYNHYDEEFDFSTGIGEDRMGLLFTETNNIKRFKSLKNPYSLIYIAETIDDSELCFLSFVNMVCAKYSKKHRYFDIVIPPSIEYFLEDYRNEILKIVTKYFPNVAYKGKDDEYSLISNDNSNKVVTFRADILPVNYTEMNSLMHYSVQDILLTGDQSITDVLSCCPKKNIFYQIAGWKEDFAYELSKLLPNKYISNIETSCGTLKAIKYKSNYIEFVKEWDFSKLAKPKMDSIVLAAIFKKENKNMVQGLEDIITSSKNVDTLKSKMIKYLEL